MIYIVYYIVYLRSLNSYLSKSKNKLKRAVKCLIWKIKRSEMGKRIAEECLERKLHKILI